MYYKTTEFNISSKGFSLIEVLVSLALFSIVVTMSVGTLVVLMDANAKAQETRELVNQVSMVLDGMAREIRTGYQYQCRDIWVHIAKVDPSKYDLIDCPTGGTKFAFTETGGSLTTGKGSSRIGYRISDGVIERRLGYDSDWLAMTPVDKVNITNLQFTTTGTSLSDTVSPTVTIIIEGEIAVSLFSDPDKFILQTTVSQQSLDI